jgi:hypothetical protein
LRTVRGAFVVALVALGVAVAQGGCDSTKSCGSSADCGSGESCLFAVGSCGARGQCLSPSSFGAQCNHVVQYCGCDGQTVGGLCGPDYAFAPTLGNDGPCGPPATVVAGSSLTILASLPQSAPQRLATDGKNVYFASVYRGAVMQVPVGGGSVTTLASGQVEPMGVAVDSTDVYFTDEGVNASGAVVKVPIGGGAITTLAANLPTPDQIALDDANVYFTTITGTPGVMKIAKTGGTPSRLATATSLSLAVGGSNVYFGEGSSVVSVPVGGGQPATLATADVAPFALAIDSQNLYWTTLGGVGTVVKQPLDGGAPTTLASGSAPEGVVVDQDTVYFTSPGSSNDGTVSSVPIAGGAVTTLVTGQSAPEGIALDAHNLYWVDTQLGAVMRLTPK